MIQADIIGHSYADSEWEARKADPDRLMKHERKLVDYRVNTHYSQRVPHLAWLVSHDLSHDIVSRMQADYRSWQQQNCILKEVSPRIVVFPNLLMQQAENNPESRGQNELSEVSPPIDLHLSAVLTYKRCNLDSVEFWHINLFLFI